MAKQLHGYWWHESNVVEIKKHDKKESHITRFYCAEVPASVRIDKFGL